MKVRITVCPINSKKCGSCVYQKEGLCDYPYIGALKIIMEI